MLRRLQQQGEGKQTLAVVQCNVKAPNARFLMPFLTRFDEKIGAQLPTKRSPSHGPRYVSLLMCLGHIYALLLDNFLLLFIASSLLADACFSVAQLPWETAAG